MVKKKMRHKWLITCDLDGTLLKSRGGRNQIEIHPTNIKVIKQLVNAGHIVAIVTGRPWVDTEVIYKKLGLKTIVGNYNGAFINDPNDKHFVPMSITVNRFIAMELIALPEIKAKLTNIIVEDEESPIIWKRDERMETQFHISDTPNLRVNKNLNKKIERNPYSIILELEDKDGFAHEAIYLLKRRFGFALALRVWDNPKYKGVVYLEINSYAINKSHAIRKIAAYYNIPMYRTIAFGDGMNDIEMLNDVAYGVAMKNASDTVKSYAKDITDFTNDDGGVGEYLKKFFNTDIK